MYLWSSRLPKRILRLVGGSIAGRNKLRSSASRRTSTPCNAACMRGGAMRGGMCSGMRGGMRGGLRQASGVGNAGHRSLEALVLPLACGARVSRFSIRHFGLQAKMPNWKMI